MTSYRFFFGAVAVPAPVPGWAAPTTPSMTLKKLPGAIFLLVDKKNKITIQAACSLILPLNPLTPKSNSNR